MRSHVPSTCNVRGDKIAFVLTKRRVMAITWVNYSEG